MLKKKRDAVWLLTLGIILSMLTGCGKEPLSPPTEPVTAIEAGGITILLEKAADTAGIPYAEDMAAVGMELYQIADPQTYMMGEEFSGKVYTSRYEVTLQEVPAFSFELDGNKATEIRPESFLFLDEVMDRASYGYEDVYTASAEDGTPRFMADVYLSESSRYLYFYTRDLSFAREHGYEICGLSADSSLEDIVRTFGYPVVMDIYMPDNEPSYAILYYSYNSEHLQHDFWIVLVENAEAKHGYFVGEYIMQEETCLDHDHEHTEGGIANE